MLFQLFASMKANVLWKQELEATLLFCISCHIVTCNRLDYICTFFPYKIPVLVDEVNKRRTASDSSN